MRVLKTYRVQSALQDIRSPVQHRGSLNSSPIYMQLTAEDRRGTKTEGSSRVPSLTFSRRLGAMYLGSIWVVYQDLGSV